MSGRERGQASLAVNRYLEEHPEIADSFFARMCRALPVVEFAGNTEAIVTPKFSAPLEGAEDSLDTYILRGWVQATKRQGPHVRSFVCDVVRLDPVEGFLGDRLHAPGITASPVVPPKPELTVYDTGFMVLHAPKMFNSEDIERQLETYATSLDKVVEATRLRNLADAPTL